MNNLEVSSAGIIEDKTRDILNNSDTLDKNYINAHSTFNPNLLYDKIINDYGYGKEMWKIIFCSLVIYFISCFCSIIFSMMVVAYKAKYNLTDLRISMIGSGVFLSKSIGCLVVGYLTYKIPREKIVYYLTGLVIILNFLNGVIDEINFIQVTECVYGFISGLLEIIVNNLLCEYLPIYNRSFTLNAVWVGTSMTQISVALIQLMTMPHMEAEGIQHTFLIINIPIFIGLLILIIFLRDSPRNLILHGEEEGAFLILIKFKESSFFTKEEREQIIREVKNESNYLSIEGGTVFNLKGAFREIFSKKYRLFFFVVSFILFFTGLLNDGLNLITGLVLQKLNIQNKKSDSTDSIITNSLLIYFINCFSYFLFGWLSEIKFLGRKIAIFLGLLGITLVLIPSIFAQNYLPIFIALIFFFLAVNNLVTSYGGEVYPTSIRDMAVGWQNVFYYIGSALSQYLLIWLLGFGLKVPFIVMLIMSILCLGVIWLSPYETYGTNLDIDLKIKEDNTCTLTNSNPYYADRDEDKEKLM